MPSEETKVCLSILLYVYAATQKYRRSVLFVQLIWAVYVSCCYPAHRPLTVLQTFLHYGWIPFIIYVGYTRSNPQPSLIKCVFRLSLFLQRVLQDL
jgi:TOM7 family